MQMNLPSDVRFIIGELEKAGYEAYAVGGCVRDSILGREPDDWDITTSASPLQVKEIFRRTVDTGIQHGTVTVMMDKEGYEVTTYRIDGEYLDGRHPKEVIFTSLLSEDLRRRDFTINAMAYNDQNGLVDLFGGIDDLNAGIIRCVGEASERFSEDALRIMRAVRFAAQLGFEIEEKTAEAAAALCGNLSMVSAERIQVELNKLLVSAHPERLEDMYTLGITKVVLPEFDRIMETEQNNPHHMYSVGGHTLEALKNVPATRALRYAMLFHDFGKPDCMTTDDAGIDHFHGHPLRSKEIAETIMRRLKFDTDTMRMVESLVLWHDVDLGATEGQVRRRIHKVGEDIYPKLFDVKRADMLAQSMYQREEKEAMLTLSRELYAKVLLQKDCLSLKDLKVNGKDLMELGFPKGPQIGQMLGRLLDDVLEHPEHNERDYLLGLLKTWM